MQECKTNKFFGNKLWQATKFTVKWRAVLATQFPKTDRRHRSPVAWEHEQDVRVMDKWILSRLNFMLAEVNEALSGDNFHIATAALKNFLYYEFCDVYLVTHFFFCLAFTKFCFFSCVFSTRNFISRLGYKENMC